MRLSLRKSSVNHFLARRLALASHNLTQHGFTGTAVSLPKCRRIAQVRLTFQGYLESFTLGARRQHSHHEEMFPLLQPKCWIYLRTIRFRSHVTGKLAVVVSIVRQTWRKATSLMCWHVHSADLLSGNSGKASSKLRRSAKLYSNI